MTDRSWSDWKRSRQQDDPILSPTDRYETEIFKLMIALHPECDLERNDYPKLPGAQVCSLGCQGEEVPDGHEGFVVTLSSGKRYLVTVSPLER